MMMKNMGEYIRKENIRNIWWRGLVCLSAFLFMQSVSFQTLAQALEPGAGMDTSEVHIQKSAGQADWHEPVVREAEQPIGEGEPYAGNADPKLTRYVKVKAPNEERPIMNGLSWATAHTDLQKAIEDLRIYMQNNYIHTGGRIFVAEGTYKPTESTEELGGGSLYASFKVYEGITLYGGFAGTEQSPDERSRGSNPWDFTHETILSGNLSQTTPKFIWNEQRQSYDVAFNGSSYHVVWFATKGFKEQQRANGLAYQAGIDGFTIMHGNANYRPLDGRSHSGYGGGVYMVDKSTVSHCKITECMASRRGGAVYMDGGGLLEHCYVYKNEVTGVGISHGYGGGVCADQGGLVKHCHITDNHAQRGGGLALTFDKNYPGIELWKPPYGDCFNVVAVASVVANNTSAIEAGGVYMDKGGVLNHMTVVNNKCNGTGMVIEGLRTGRSAGVFMNGWGNMFNSVCWGGKIRVNSDVPFASHAIGDERAYINFSAFSRHDLIDWSTAVKKSVISIDAKNVPASAEALVGKAYPLFQDTTAISGVRADVSLTLWQPLGNSALSGRGIQLQNLTDDNRTRLIHAEIIDDLNGALFEARTDLGAYRAKKVRSKSVVTGTVEHLFVDADRQGGVKAITGTDSQFWGDSWNTPLHSLNEALDYFRTNAPAPEVTTRQIHVKEGTYTTEGYYYHNSLRSSTIRMVSGVEVLGGYPEEALGTDVSQRNPMAYPTFISGDVSNDNFSNNVIHVVLFNGVNNAILDGFHIENGNAVSEKVTVPQLKKGAGVLCWNKGLAAGQTMTGNAIRNCVVSNCAAEQGAAVYVESVNGAVVELAMTNCIVHNNSDVTITLDAEGNVTGRPWAAEGAAVCVEGSGSKLSLDFCSVLKNVGYGLNVLNEGQLSLNNSMVWANANQKIEDSENLTSANLLCIRPGSVVTGSNNLFDKDFADAGSLGDAVLTIKNGEPGFPAFVNPTRNIGVTLNGHVTVYGGLPNFMPENTNPVVNAASEAALGTVDMTSVTQRIYGGLPDVGALENTNLPEKGKVIYVRDLGVNDNKGGNGSSWGKAINGNCTAFVNDHGFQGVDAELYAENHALTGLQWAVDEAFYRSLTKEAGDKKIKYTTKSVFCILDENVDGNYQQRNLSFSEVDPSKLVQVWVAQGEYIRPDGFFMRDGVDVLGGFPEKWNNPGLKERSPKAYPTHLQTRETGDETFGPERGYAGEADSGEQVTEQSKTTILSKEGWSVTQPKLFTAKKDNWVQSVLNLSSGEWSNLYDGNSKSLIKCNVPQADSYWAIFTTNSYITFYVDLGRECTFNRIGLEGLQSSAGSLNVLINGSNDLSSEGRTLWNISAKTTPQNIEKELSEQSYRYLFIKVENSDTKNNKTFSLGEITLKNYTEGKTCRARYDLNAYKYAYGAQRVLTQPYPYYNESGRGSMEKINVPVNPFSRMTSWDGFVICNGRTQISHGRDGGAGVALRHNGRIVNCMVVNNVNQSRKQGRGGGIFCNGGEIVNCVVENNIMNNTSAGNDGLGGGLYLRNGIVYNTCFAKNKSYKDGRENGEALPSGGYRADGAAVFFEIGIFYNNTISGNIGAHALSTGNYFTDGSINIYNSIIYDNTSVDGGVDFLAKTNLAFVDRCLFDGEIAGNKEHITNLISGDPKFVNSAQNDFSLQAGSPAINAGDNNPGGITLPSFDANYDARIQDCRVDIGAFETNTAYAITPTAKEDNGVTYYNYYVAQVGLGNASADSPANVACSSKLQLVLDAAGRYKKANPTRKVRVCLSGDDVNNASGFTYAPTRSVYSKELHLAENPRTYSLIVPHGVEVWGGYSPDFGQRDILKYKTTLSGEYQSESQLTHVYHIVTFTNDTFDEKENVAGKDALTGIADCAVLDGLFLENGQATGEVDGDKDKDRYGGAAHVPGYAHIRNCILRNNTATNGGGALYLEPNALVSGCLFEKNTAERGGAIYVEPQAEGVAANPTTMAKVYTSTIVYNRASGAGGGIWFYDNLRINSSVLWQNTGSEQANVSGQVDPFSTEVTKPTEENYPFAYSAVENLRMPGLNNISVSSEEKKGVHFEENDEYYGLKKLSQLGRMGMPIEKYDNLVVDYALAAKDIKNVDRVYSEGTAPDVVRGVNKFIEIGARAYPGKLIVIPSASNLLKRLFVVPIDQSNPDYITALVDKGGSVYSQPGSSMANPMPHLDDALEYIQTARKENGKETKDLDFEIFVSGGVYYPYRTVTGAYGISRNNTFLVPEGVSIYGGIAFTDATCYAQSSGQLPNDQSLKSIPLKLASTNDILSARKQDDLNANDIIEPWEFSNPTILSGQVVSAEDSKGVYHVVTILSDENYVGTLPTSPKTVVLNGLQVVQGDATGDFVPDETVSGSPFIDVNYYAGGAICVDGGISGSPRNVPLELHRCSFINNKAGIGGAIYSDGDIRAHSCSFAQNVAMKGSGKRYDGKAGSSPINVSFSGYGGAVYGQAKTQIVNTLMANNEAEVGGAVYASASGKLHMLNSNVVRNKALSEYPALYAETPNKPQSEQNCMVNTVLWGNESSGTNLVINYDNESLNAATEALWFCAYEENRGKQPAFAEGKDMREAAFNDKQTVLELMPNSNNNVWLNADNRDIDGPNFRLPSMEAGASGYMEAADWMLSRMNNLTDKGWTKMNQTITPIIGEGGVVTGHQCTFNKDENGFIGAGFYYAMANKHQLPLGDDVNYMYKKNYLSDDLQPMYRISKDPNPTHEQTYIDIGLYEYQHISLDPDVKPGAKPKDHIDILWVSATEKTGGGEPNGKTWETPTSNLQRAIETLLSSRNGHQKEIRIIQGIYGPNITVVVGKENGQDIKKQAFVVDTKSMNQSAFVESGAVDLGIENLTIKGGYSEEIKGLRNVEDYPSVLRMPRGANSYGELNTLFWIENTIQRIGCGENAKTEKNVIPLTFDGLTFSNPVTQAGGLNSFGSALYYKEQMQDGLSILAEAPAAGKKLMLKRCIFAGSGSSENTTAVKIDAGGGESLIVNSLFHSNAGRSLETVDTRVLNCTFALNGGNVKFNANRQGQSALYNSVLWYNNRADASAGVSDVEGTAHLSAFKNNAMTTGFDNVDNVELVEENNNIIEGPNFVNPDISAHAYADCMKRDFHLRPSVKLLNTADIKAFATEMGMPLTNEDDIATALTDSLDLAFSPRYHGKGMDLGAYEYPADLLRYIYVDPNMTQGSQLHDGSAWEQAFENGRLQQAVDLAAVYTIANASETDPALSYVFVKGGKTGVPLVFRNGVSIYGSIEKSYAKMHSDFVKDGQIDISGFEADVVKSRPGLLSPFTNRTVINGLNSAIQCDKRTLIDGFEITPSVAPQSENGLPDRPLVQLYDKTGCELMLRNTLIHGGKNTNPTVVQTGMIDDALMLGNASIVNIKSGSLYNVLLRNCQVSQGNPLVMIQSGIGRVIHSTIVGNSDCHTVFAWDTTPQQVINSITYNEFNQKVSRGGEQGSVYFQCNEDADGYPFAPYLKPTTVPKVPAHLTDNENLWYQLQERSKSLDACKSDDAGLKAILKALPKGFVNFDTDRDLLGNPRKMHAKNKLAPAQANLDRGCFETWKIGSAKKPATRVVTFAGNQYPHDGSVVYINSGSKLIVDPAPENIAALNEIGIISPAYLILDEGASIYGNGAKMRFNYMAVEKEMNRQGKLLALPFKWSSDDVVKVAYEAGTGCVKHELVPLTTSTYTYDGQSRAAWNYRFKATDSELWIPVSAGADGKTQVQACEGVFICDESQTSDELEVYRFTGYADIDQALYEEKVEDNGRKAIQLTQYNNRPRDGKSLFTYEENMGWNLKGIPFLVSDYVSGSDEGSPSTPMDRPHLLYQLGADGNYSPLESWKKESRISVGEAYFMQTATLDNVENLYFNLPQASVGPSKSVDSYIALESAAGKDVVTIRPHEGVTDFESYQLGSDAIKWMAYNETLPQIYAVNADDTWLALMSAAPEETEIPLGIRAPIAGSYKLSLPEKTAFSAYSAVWLKDNKLNRCVNLLDDEYRFLIDSDEDVSHRLTVQFGGEAPETDSDEPRIGKRYQVSVQHGYLTISGLEGGERIRVLTVSGQLLETATGTVDVYRTPVERGIYVVEINRQTFKVVY